MSIENFIKKIQKEKLGVNNSENKYLEMIQEKKRKVRSKEYLDWLYETCIKNEIISDDVYCQNKKNVRLLSFFLGYIDELAQKQRVLNVPDPENEFCARSYVIRIKDLYLNISDMIGQGSVVFVNKTKKPDFCYVKVEPDENF